MSVNTLERACASSKKPPQLDPRSCMNRKAQIYSVKASQLDYRCWPSHYRCEAPTAFPPWCNSDSEGCNRVSDSKNLNSNLNSDLCCSTRSPPWPQRLRQWWIIGILLRRLDVLIWLLGSTTGLSWCDGSLLYRGHKWQWPNKEKRRDSLNSFLNSSIV